MLNQNHHIGAQYDGSRDVTEDAKLIRRDIAAAKKMGLIADAKYSVRIDRFSMGQSIDVTVTGEGLVELVEDAEYGGVTRQRTALGQETVDFIKAITSTYNHDRSDTQTDYFDVKFYSGVNLKDPK